MNQHIAAKLRGRVHFGRIPDIDHPVGSELENVAVGLSRTDIHALVYLHGIHINNLEAVTPHQLHRHRRLACGGWSHQADDIGFGFFGIHNFSE